ncbi:MAG: hypothetical protein H0U75_13520 [Legionella sp.]|nr:hypothetical protein [Legionella sp.]
MFTLKDSMDELVFKKKIKDVLDQLTEIVDFRPQVVGVQNYQKLSSLLKALRDLRKINPGLHDNLIDSKGRYSQLWSKFTHWSEESVQNIQKEQQNQIIREAIAKYSTILLKNGLQESKDSNPAQDALLRLMDSQTALDYKEVYGRLNNKSYLKLFLEYMNKNTSIRALSFQDSKIGHEAACHILTSLQSHPTIETLDLRGYDMLKTAASPTVIEFIKKNQALKELFTEHLSGSLPFDEEDAKQFEDALTTNLCLTTLQITHHASKSAHLKTIAQLLERNRRSQISPVTDNSKEGVKNRQDLTDILIPLQYDLDKITDIFTNHDEHPKDEVLVLTL